MNKSKDLLVRGFSSQFCASLVSIMTRYHAFFGLLSEKVTSLLTDSGILRAAYFSGVFVDLYY